MFYPPRAVQKLLSRHRLLLVSIALTMILQVALLVLLPLPIRAALDRLTGANAAPVPWGLSLGSFLALLAISALLIGLLGSVLEYLEDRGTGILARVVVTDLRRTLIERVLTRRLAYLNRKRKVDLLGRISGDVQNLELYCTTMLSVAIRSVPSIVLVLGAMLLIQWRYALLLFVFLAATYLIGIRLARRIKTFEKKFRHHTTALEHDLLQSLNAMPLIKSLQGEARTGELLTVHQNTANGFYDQTRCASATMNAVFSAGRHLQRAVVILLGGWAVLHGQLTLGSLFAFISYLEVLAKPVMEIANYFSRASKAAASLERIEELNIELANSAELSGGERLGKDGGLSFERVSFAYESGHVVLSEFDLRLHSGLIAMVGESGAGKSTLIRLFNRLIDPSSGRIFLNGTDLSKALLSDLRRQVCVVSQEPFLLSASLRDNLRWSLDTPVTDQEIWRALAQAGAAGFVKDLEQSLDTPIGDGGIQLSGGQAKRISLARGFLRAKIARILVFDEPTSGLDPLSAQAVMNSISQLSQGSRLIVFSTHRITDVLIADEILFLGKGEPPRFGRHEDLQGRSPGYLNLVRELVLEEAR